MKAVVLREDLNHDPYLLWNEFVRFLATTASDKFEHNQRPAHLAFCYDSEIQNGGHHQYFENQGVNRAEEVICALEVIGASRQASILRRAAERWGARARQRSRTAEEYVAEALVMEFSDLDADYYSANPTVIELLERLLENQTDTYVQIVG